MSVLFLVQAAGSGVPSGPAYVATLLFVGAAAGALVACAVAALSGWRERRLAGKARRASRQGSSMHPRRAPAGEAPAAADISRAPAGEAPRPEAVDESSRPEAPDPARVAESS